MSHHQWILFPGTSSVLTPSSWQHVWMPHQGRYFSRTLQWAVGRISKSRSHLSTHHGEIPLPLLEKVLSIDWPPGLRHRKRTIQASSFPTISHAQWPGRQSHMFCTYKEVPQDG